MVVWEVVQGLGAVVGLATGLFVLYERLLKDAPLHFLFSAPLSLGSVNKVCYLRIVNRSPRPMLVSWQNGERRYRLGLAADHSSRAIIESILDGTSKTVLDGGESRDFVVMKPSNYAAIEPDNVMETTLHWEFAQPVWYRRPRKIRVTIAKRSFMHLLGEDDPTQEG